MKFRLLIALVLTNALAATSLHAQLTFTKIADASTAIPGGTGSFIDSNFGSPAIYGTNVAFYGKGSSGQQGVYLWSGGALSRVADLTTAIPGGSGNFTNFSSYEQFVTSGGAVLFVARGTSGIYKKSGGTLSRVVDRSFAVPGGAGNFTNVFSANESGGVSAFIGQDALMKYGIYTYNGTAVTAIVDTNTALPGSSAAFNFTDYVINDGGSLAFWAYRTDNSQGIYSYASGALHSIAGTNTTVPGTASKFTSLLSPPNINGNTVTFVGIYTGGSGIFGASADGTGLMKLVDTSMTAPGVTNRFANFYGGFSYLSGTLYFACNIAGGSGMGIYSVSGGTVGKVLVSGDTLDGKTVKAASFDGYGLGGGAMGMIVSFTDNSTALYATSIASSSSGPSFTSPSFSGGGFQMNLSLTAGQAYRLQGTTNAGSTTNWVTLTNITSAPATLQFLDTAATALPFRFYRLISP